MQQPCPRCGSVIDGNSRFCTNCGTVLQAGQGSRWGAPPQQSAPPWASAGSPAPYQQQMADPGGLGFGGPGNAQARRLLTMAVSLVLGALLLLIVSLALVFAGPSGTRGFFLVVALLLILIPWIIYHQIRRIIRRTVGRIWWFL